MSRPCTCPTKPFIAACSFRARGVLKKELIKHLRSNRVMRHSKVATTKGQPRGQIIDGVSIRERPASIEDRAIPGHWEGDLIAGSKKHAYRNTRRTPLSIYDVGQS